MTTHPASEDESDRKHLMSEAQRAWMELWINATPKERRAFVEQHIVTLNRDPKANVATIVAEQVKSGVIPAHLAGEAEKLFAQLGVPKFIDDSHKVAGHNPHEDQDAADSPRSSEGFSFEKLDKGQLAGVLMETFPGLPPGTAKKIASWHTERVSDAVRKRSAVDISRALGPLISAANPKMAIAGLAFALNLASLNGLGSIRQWAKENGVSPEALSKKKRQWEEELDLEPGPHGKTPKARKALSQAQKTKHYTKKKFSRKKP